MTLEEAQSNIGNPFKWTHGGSASGYAGRFDTIRKVSSTGYIYGDWLSAHHEDCRLKQEQPEHLKKQNDEK